MRSPGWIEIRGAAVHNLKHVDARIPLAALTAITGVSGSGKSSLVHDVLARSVRRATPSLRRLSEGEYGVVTLPAIDRLIEVDQSPIGRTPRSTPATATGLFDEIRRVFAMTREARIRGYGPGRFSFNARGGRCETCLGLGHRRIPMNYLPDLYVTCEECGGKRYNRQTLEVRFKGKSIGDVLEMRVDESRAFFDAVPRVLQGLEALHDVGLGYLTLGQSSTTLSGGEAQRVKLAAELGRPAPAGGRRPSTSSTSRPPGCTSPTSTACSASSTAWSTWATPSSSSSTTSTSSPRPTGSSTWAPTPARPAAGSSPWDRPHVIAAAPESRTGWALRAARHGRDSLQNRADPKNPASPSPPDPF